MELKIDTFGSQQALAGVTGASEYQGYTGNQVLGAYTKVDGFDWGLISEVSSSEAFAGVSLIRTAVILVGIISMLAVFAAAYFFSRSITEPLKVIQVVTTNMSVGDLNRNMSEEAKAKVRNRKDEIGDVAKALTDLRMYMTELAETASLAAKGDLTVNVESKSAKDELGIAFAGMINGLRSMVGQITQNAKNLTAASDQLANAADQSGKAAGQIADTIQQVASGTAQQSDAVNHTAISIEQMTHAIDGIAKGAQDQTREVTRAAEITGQITKAIQQVSNNAKAGAIGSGKAAEVAQGGAQIVAATIKGMRPSRPK